MKFPVSRITGRYLKELNPELNMLTIASAEQARADALKAKNEGVANFIPVIPSTMTKTY